MRILRLLFLAITVGTMTGCDTTADFGAVNLAGEWDAIVYEYTDNANATVIDIIQRDGASFMLTVDSNGEASTLFDNGLGNTSSDSGTLNSTETTLTLAGVTYTAELSGDVLTLRDPDSSFDFGNGSVSASLRIVMIRD